MSAATDSPATLDRIPAAALHRLSLGFYFLFWGLLILLMALTESMTGAMVRPLTALLIGGGSLGLANGAWQLHRVDELGLTWRRRTRELLVTATLVAYLSLFYLIWRRVPANLYLLAHVLGFFALLLLTLCLASSPVVLLARLADRQNLAIQAGAFATITIVLLFPPFGLVALRMVETARQGIDPYAMLQVWIQRTALWITLTLLVPFSLILSLLWTAKDLVHDQLNSCEPPR